jgi:heparosan-N-sulfate-glucuronate 5-epimerase
MGRLDYYQRIFSAYLSPQKSHLTFWHGEPQVNENFEPGKLGEYYMPFIAKADYPGHYDENGIPMLDYHGSLGLQYNPIAIAQYGLGNYDLYWRTKEEHRKSKFLNAAYWLVENLEETPEGTKVWNHHFDWEYRDKLRAPWYSGLAQGQGISLLLRAYAETKDGVYLDAARRAFGSFLKTPDEDGVTWVDEEGNTWFEEYIVSPPTHILNGFIWASWGVYDYFLATGEPIADRLFKQAVQTLTANLRRYDVGFWSLYEQSGTRLKMLASPFYHQLHIVQLKVLYQLTKEDVFRKYALRWEKYGQSRINRTLALAHKAMFKLLYY